nr:hypothetical protein [Cupriavidus sp. CV2]
MVDTGAALVIVTETPQELRDLGIFTHIGVYPHVQRAVVTAPGVVASWQGQSGSRPPRYPAAWSV